MAMLNCSYGRLLLKVLYEVFVLAVFLPFCLSAVENCRPCGPGEFCSVFLGICLACKDYCPGDADCPSVCTPIKPNFTTFAPTTTGPTSIQLHTTSQSMTTSTSSGASAVVVQQSTDANIPSGGANTILDNAKPVWLVVCLFITLFITLCIIVFLIFLCIKNRKTLNMPSKCYFSSGDSENESDIELGERPRSNRGRIGGTEWTIRTNPMTNLPPGCHQTTGTAVQVDDVDCHDTIKQPGPSQLNSSRPSRSPRPNAEDTAPGDPTHSASGSRKTPDHLDANLSIQTASVHPTQTPLQEFEPLRGACPSDRRSSQNKTPDTHRKITDGTHEGHLISIGVSSFNPPNGMCEDFQWKRHSGHGD